MEFKPINKELLSPLTKAEAHVLLHQGTETPFSGELNADKGEGSYYCKQCGSPLFHSDAKFDSGSGWPSFDEALTDAVLERGDSDGVRIEAICATCQGHLGHLFRGEQFTPRNKRYCVNSIALEFKAGPPQAEALYAGGCFWGVEYLFRKLEGVNRVISGYTGGEWENPSYDDVLSQASGHYEAVKVIYDPRQISYEQLTKFFFEIHDPTQIGRQGPDIGPQYSSALFYRRESEWEIAHHLLDLLKKRGLKVVTEILSAKRFWPAEKYHQNYYEKKGSLPYCHAWQKRF